jgi:hypothetical protein
MEIVNVGGEAEPITGKLLEDVIKILETDCVGKVKGTQGALSWFVSNYQDKKPKISTFEEFFERLAKTIHATREFQKQMNKWEKPGKASIDETSDNIKSHNKKKPFKASKVPSEEEAPREQLPPCNTCGRCHPQTRPCRFSEHPDRNPNPKVPWSKSDKGKEWLEKGYRSIHSVAPLAETETRVLKEFDSNKRKTDAPKKWDNKRIRKCELYNSYDDNNDSIDPDDDLVDVTVFLPETHTLIPVRALLDTGAKSSNYISVDLAVRLKQHNVSSCACNATVCGPIKGSACANSSVNFNLELILKDENTGNLSRIPFTAKAIPQIYDLTIGKRTLKEHNIALIYPSHFFSNIEENTEILAAFRQPSATNEGVSSETASRARCLSPRSTLAPEEGMEIADERTDARVVVLKGSSVTETTEQPVERTVTGLHAIDSDPNHEPTEDDPKSSLIPSQIYGPPSLQSKLRSLCYEFVDIFDTQVRPTPAKIPPMKVDIDIKKWNEMRRNKLPARVQSAGKQLEIQKQVSNMLKNNVIEPSRAASYSQVHMTPKPFDMWRFCIDFILLNLCTIIAHNWPIPNIKEMLQRLGKKKPEYIGVMDLTSGYHQAPLDPTSSIFTAFICFCGIYQWLRVPMGLRGAASYFQYSMATVVLAGLIYITCEAYLDDIITTGRTEDEFVSNLRQIFERFREFNITLNPTKTRLGMPEAQYVGHVLNKHGLSFSREKKDSVLNFAKPIFSKQLKSFIGLANYFRDHIRHHSDIVKPLNMMLRNYDKNRKLVWTDETTKAFEEIKRAIHECPTLFFPNDTDPIHVYTDASDYGIGAYICQIVDGIERAVAFMSMTLIDEKTRWSTLDKEAYAIYYTFQRYEYLLRDVKCTVHTDHKNLIHLHDDSAPKVRRWWLFLQEFKMDIVHIAGIKNEIADSMSRLCPVTEQEIEYYNTLEELEIPDEHYRTIGKVHNTTQGHFGVETTIKHLIRDGFQTWEKMRTHVRSFIQKCPCCQKMSVLKLPIHTSPYTTASYRSMERLNVDTLGPFPTDSEGNNYVIVVIDTFTRFLELYPAKDCKAVEAAKALLIHVGRYGAPYQIRSDNGTQYVNNMITELLRLIGITHETILAYSHEENAIVERANKEVLRHLRTMIYDENVMTEWRKYLPLIQRIMNSTVHSRTGAAPAQLLFGNACNLTRGIFNSREQVEQTHHQDIPLSEWASDMLKRQAYLISVAEENQIAQDKAHIAANTHELTDFPVGSYVLIDYQNTGFKSGPPTKPLTPRKGPLRVLSKDASGNQYTLLNLTNNKEEQVHITRIHPFNHDEAHTNPTAVANKDVQLFQVEKILKHKGTKARRAQMEFRVKWLGYDDSDNSWVKWKDISHNAILHNYLRDHNMATIIPPQYTRA